MLARHRGSEHARVVRIFSAFRSNEIITITLLYLDSPLPNRGWSRKAGDASDGSHAASTNPTESR